jgi:hypothetical protein
VAGEFHVQPSIDTSIHEANLHGYTPLPLQSRPKIDDIFLLTEVNGQFKIKVVVLIRFDVILWGFLELLRPPGPLLAVLEGWKGACVPPKEYAGLGSYRTFCCGVLLGYHDPSRYGKRTSQPLEKFCLRGAVASLAEASGEPVIRLSQVTFCCEDILIHGN